MHIASLISIIYHRLCKNTTPSISSFHFFLELARSRPPALTKTLRMPLIERRITQLVSMGSQLPAAWSLLLPLAASGGRMNLKHLPKQSFFFLPLHGFTTVEQLAISRYLLAALSPTLDIAPLCLPNYEREKIQCFSRRKAIGHVTKLFLSCRFANETFWMYWHDQKPRK